MSKRFIYTAVAAVWISGGTGYAHEVPCQPKEWRPAFGAAAIGSGLIMTGIGWKMKARVHFPVVAKDSMKLPVYDYTRDRYMVHWPRDYRVFPGVKEAQKLETFFQSAYNAGAKRAVVRAGNKRWKTMLHPKTFGRSAEFARLWIADGNFQFPQPPYNTFSEGFRPLKVSMEGLGGLRKFFSVGKKITYFGGAGLCFAGVWSLKSWRDEKNQKKRSGP